MNLTFETPLAEHQKIIQPILSGNDTNSFSAAFGSYFLWAHEHKTLMAVKNNLVLIKYNFEIPEYEFSKGSADDKTLSETIRYLFEDSRSSGNSEFKFRRLLKHEAQKLSELFPNKFEFLSSRNDFEYVYNMSDMANLKGKKYHSKRNHISKFSKLYDWEYSPLNPKYNQEYIVFFESWFKLKPDANPGEMFAIQKALRHFDELGMEGGTVSIDNKIVACTIGERVSENTFTVHFEKALPEFAEAYTVINNQFCKQISDRYKYVNREEDLGIEGLRKAKLSYHPCELIEKYTATATSI